MLLSALSVKPLQVPIYMYEYHDFVVYMLDDPVTAVHITHRSIHLHAHAHHARGSFLWFQAENRLTRQITEADDKHSA